MKLLLLLLLSLLLDSQIDRALATATPAPPTLPLSTKSRWIVDATGRRVKLACANWAAHMEAGVAEGLAKQPLGDISRRIGEMGFNCVRLTWPTYLVTDPTFGSLTVRHSLEGLGLIESTAGVQVNNPQLIDLTLVQAFQAVVSNLASNDILVILDNQITKPGWCCTKFDGNGFFGDKYFDPDEWLEGLTQMAALSNGSNNVVGMSLRNELRGPNQNLSEWYKYMQMGAEAVHSANPSVLVILSGLDYDKDLSFLFEKQVKLSFSNKVVFELHWYGFSDGQDWENGNPNESCGNAIGNFTRKGGFLLEEGWPLFLSEFGVDVSGTHVGDNRFLSCFLSVAAKLDLDWAIWALQGSYYLREGQLSFDETYGMMSWDWCKARNSSFIQRISSVQSPFQGPGLSNSPPYDIIFHPLTGLCVLKTSLLKPAVLGPCIESEAWNFTGNIMLDGTGFCLQGQDVGEPVRFGINCSCSSSKWQSISDSKMQFAMEVENNGSSVCLDVRSDGTVITSLCKCITGDGLCSPESQWFKIISSTRDISENSHLKLFSKGSWDPQMSLELQDYDLRHP